MTKSILLYLSVFQEDNTNKASIKRCHHNSSYSCIDESHAESSSPYLVKGRQRSYWLKVNSDDNGVAIGHQGEEIPFVAFKPGFGHEVGIHWIGLSGANAGVTWQFCDLGKIYRTIHHFIIALCFDVVGIFVSDQYLAMHS